MSNSTVLDVAETQKKLDLVRKGESPRNVFKPSPSNSVSRGSSFTWTTVSEKEDKTDDENVYEDLGDDDVKFDKDGNVILTDAKGKVGGSDDSDKNNSSVSNSNDTRIQNQRRPKYEKKKFEKKGGEKLQTQKRPVPQQKYKPTDPAKWDKDLQDERYYDEEKDIRKVSGFNARQVISNLFVDKPIEEKTVDEFLKERNTKILEEVEKITPKDVPKETILSLSVRLAANIQGNLSPQEINFLKSLANYISLSLINYVQRV